MASTLAILRPSAPAPLAGPRARVAAPAAARVALPSRFRYSPARVPLGSEVAAAGADALFVDYKPTTAFLFPGQDASDAANSAMVSVIGLDSEKVQQLCDAANEEVDETERVQIANFLCPGNYAVSGGVKGIEVVEAKAKSFKARMTVCLAVAGAFHTSFMRPAVSRLESALASTEFRTPRIPVISNVDALPHSDPDTIKQILARQVTSPVQWETTVKTLMGKGLEKSYELGPGKVRD
ncbi:unnamed protein product [Urochloa decumbens]|uniref:Malonyl-CoA:ACP transacylase (MAT) domain-containing protein n=1 Tax=Urochloa decumbens TaxID=240449 RepID=A0ABC8Y9M3_9POAL